jgi:hypothetical protein
LLQARCVVPWLNLHGALCGTVAALLALSITAIFTQLAAAAQLIVRQPMRYLLSNSDRHSRHPYFPPTPRRVSHVRRTISTVPRSDPIQAEETFALTHEQTMCERFLFYCVENPRARLSFTHPTKIPSSDKHLNIVVCSHKTQIHTITSTFSDRERGTIAQRKRDTLELEDGSITDH